MASALKCALQTPFSTPIRSSFADLCQWKLMVLRVAFSLCLTARSTTFILISYPLLHIFVALNWWVMELIFFFFNWLTIFWSMGAGKLFMGDSSSRHSINAGTRGAFLLALFLTRALLRLPRTFSPIYTLPPSPHSPISTLLILLRESSPPLLSLDCPLLPSTCCWRRYF